MNTIDIFTENISLPYNTIDASHILDLVNEVFTELQLNKVIVSVIITDNEYIHGINKEYRDKDQPTDVISFANRDDDSFPMIESDEEELGDIFISFEKAVEQAKEYETSFRDEVKRLLIHGILHLVGYDHERSQNDEDIMRRKEEELFAKVTI